MWSSERISKSVNLYFIADEVLRLFDVCFFSFQSTVKESLFERSVKNTFNIASASETKKKYVICCHLKPKAIPNIPCRAFLIQFPTEKSSRFIFNIKTKVGMEKLWALNKLIPISELTSRVKVSWWRIGGREEAEKQNLKHAKSCRKDNDHDFFHHLFVDCCCFREFLPFLQYVEHGTKYQRLFPHNFIYVTKLCPTPIDSAVPLYEFIKFFQPKAR